MKREEPRKLDGKLEKTTKINNSNTAVQTINRRNYTPYILLALFGIFLIVAPCYSGLYFRRNYIPSIIIISILFLAQAAWMFKSRQFSIVENYIDVGILGIAAAYGLSFIFGVSKMDSFDGMLKYIALFMVYKLIYQFAKDEKAEKLLPDLFILAGFAMAFIAMLASAGIVHMVGVFGWSDRLAGLYEYPNATASVLAALFLLTVVLLPERKHMASKMLHGIFAASMILAFLATKSRGGILVLGIMWVVGLFILKDRNKLQLMLNSAACMIAPILLYSKVFDSFVQQKGFIGLYGIVIAVTVGLIYLVELFNKKVADKFSYKRANIIIAALLIVVLAGVFAAFEITEPLTLSEAQPLRSYEIYGVKPNGNYIVQFTAQSSQNIESNLSVGITSVDKARARTAIANNQFAVSGTAQYQLEFTASESSQYVTVDFISNTPNIPVLITKCLVQDKNTGAIITDLKLAYKFIPDDIGQKLSQINLKTESSSERLVFFKDGFKIMRDYPLFGTGARGWSNLYTKYQSYNYISNEPHNFYLQVAIEAGLIGLIFLGLVLVSVAFVLFKLYRGDYKHQNRFIGIALCMIALLIHASFDFDFSLFAMAVLVWSILGLIAAWAYKNDILVLKSKNRHSLNQAAFGIMTAAALIIGILSATMTAGILNGEKAAKATNSNYDLSKVYYKKAMAQDFFNTDYLVEIGQIIAFQAQQKQNASLMGEAYETFKKAQTREPYKLNSNMLIAKFYLNNGFLEEGVSLINHIVEIQPLNPSNYEMKADVNMKILDNWMIQSKYEKALPYAQNIVAIEEQYNNALKMAIIPFALTEKTKTTIQIAKDRKRIIENKKQ